MSIEIGRPYSIVTENGQIDVSEDIELAICGDCQINSESVLLTDESFLCSDARKE